MANKTERRVKRFCITGELLLNMGSGTFEVVANELPPDAQVVDGRYDIATNMVVLLVKSETFPELHAGDDIPLVEPPQIRRVKKPGLREFL